VARLQAIFWWYGLMAAGGLAFGIIANKRPLGAGILVHPLMLYATLVVIALLALRAIARRPVPEIISDRALMYGCCAGLAAFLIGNFVGAHVLGLQ
jgi:hypothetical protein